MNLRLNGPVRIEDLPKLDFRVKRLHHCTLTKIKEMRSNNFQPDIYRAYSIHLYAACSSSIPRYIRVQLPDFLLLRTNRDCQY